MKYVLTRTKQTLACIQFDITTSMLMVMSYYPYCNLIPIVLVYYWSFVFPLLFSFLSAKRFAELAIFLLLETRNQRYIIIQISFVILHNLHG